MQLALVILTTTVLAGPVKDRSPESKPGRVCRAEKGPQPKKDVQIQPVCSPTPKPEPTKAAPGRKVEP